MEEDSRTDEDRIIESLIIEGNQSLYEDMDFLPSRQSLYNNETVIPEYDDELFDRIEWCRPQQIFPEPVYFNSESKFLAVNQGTLPDRVFLGTLMAICAYSKYDLIENVFASRPEDFVKYGIYTCRFYVDGDWVEVITDTHIPCIRNKYTGDFYPSYGNSDNGNELWVALVEKAFAKAMGSYEEIPNIKVQKALLHLTGGSVQQISLKDEVSRFDLQGDGFAWHEFKKRFSNDSLVLMLPMEKKTETDGTIDASNDGEADPTRIVTSDYFIPDMLYSVVSCKDIGGYELVLMHDPWKRNGFGWTGDWSDHANDWDLYPDILNEIENDPKMPWRRHKPNGYFWIPFRNLVRHFNRTYCCKLFPNDKFSFYCVRGECRGRHSGGPLNTVRDSVAVVKEAHASRQLAIQKATAAVVIDGDPGWFTNPQYRIQCHTPATIYVSIVPISGGEDEQEQIASNIFVSVAKSGKHINTPATLWEVSNFEVCANDKSEAGSGGPIRSKGQETSIWGLNIDPKHYYHIVANTARRNIDG